MAASSYAAGSIVSTSTSNNERGDPRFSGGGFREDEGPALEAAFGIVDAAAFATVLGVTVSSRDIDIDEFALVSSKIFTASLEKLLDDVK